jgi:hypothetical protein
MAGGSRPTAWNGQRGQPSSLPPSSAAASGPTPPEKPPPKAAANDDSDLTRLHAQVNAAREFFPAQLEAAQRELDEYREKKHQHRLATKPRHFVLITLQREVTQAQKRVESGKAAVDDVLAKIEALKLDHAAAVEELAIRQAKLDTVQRRRNDAEANPAKPPLSGEITSLKEQIAACGPALGEAGGNILKSLEAILAQLEPDSEAMSVDTPPAETFVLPTVAAGDAANNGVGEAKASTAEVQVDAAAAAPDGVWWSQKRAKLKHCLDKIKGEMGDAFNAGAFSSFSDVLDDDDGDKEDEHHDRRSRSRSRTRGQSKSDG